MATEIYQSLLPKSEYFDKTRKLSPEEYFKKLAESATLYIGNLSIFTKEEAIYDLFSRCGQIKLFKMGLNKLNNTPCGFCFIEYNTHEEAVYAVDCLSQTFLDDRIIRVDYDIGFEEGRQYGRGKSGGQVRDEFRTYEDVGRGELRNKGEQQQQQHHKGDYRHDNRRDNRDYRDNRDNRRGHSYSGGGGYRDNRNKYRGESRNESYSRQHNDSDSDGEENYRRKKTKGN